MGRTPLNPATNSVGFTAKLVTVRSISADGLTAVTVDRQNTQTTVPMTVQRSKAPVPAVGETWLLAQDLGMWTFAAFVGTVPSSSSAGTERLTVSAVAPANPAQGDLWMNAAQGYEFSQWTGTDWRVLQLGTNAIADGAVTAAKLASGTDGGGSTVSAFLGPTPPPNPALGDLWFNSAAGNQISIWNGTDWEEILFSSDALGPDAGILPNQVSFTFRDLGGLTVSMQATPPVSPLLGDLWYDASNAYLLNQWNGTSWVPFQFGTDAIAAGSVTAELIAAEAVTASKLAAGIIYAGIVDGTLISGARLEAYGTTGQVLVYSSAIPAPGDLVASISGAVGSDGEGNVYEQGIASYTKVGGITYSVGINQTGGPLGVPGLSVQDVAHPPVTAPGIFGLGSSRSGARSAFATLWSGAIDGSDVGAYVTVESQEYSGVSVPLVTLNGLVALTSFAPPGGGGGPYLYANGNSNPSAANFAGLAGQLPISQTDFSVISNATTSYDALTKVWTIPFNDPQGGTLYRLTAWGHGTQGSTQENLQMRLAGFWGNTFMSNAMDGSDIPAGQNFHWRYVAEILWTNNTALVSGGTFSWSQEVATTTSNAATAAMDDEVNSITQSGNSDIALQIGWASVTGGPTIECVGSMLERLGA